MPNMQDPADQGKQTHEIHMKVAELFIQCDETRPVCQRCAKSGRLCSGVRGGQTRSAIRIENPYASGQKKRPRGPRSNLTEELTPSPNTIQFRPVSDLKSQAIMYYLHFHMQTLKDATDISKGVSDDFLSVWMSRVSRVESPVLDLAVSSMALAVFSRTQHHPLAAIEASTNYHRLLKTAQKTILSLNERNVDTCLFAIFFMSRYEDAVHRPNPPNAKIPFSTRIRSFSHHDGALAVLKFWKERLSHSQPATDAIKHTRRSMISSALLRYLALPEWLLEGTSFGEHGLELEYDRIVLRLASVRQRLSVLLKEETTLRPTKYELSSTVFDLNKEARDIDEALKDWASHFPGAWCYERHMLPNPHAWPMRDFYSPMVHSYSSPAYAAVWAQYYATRMLAISTRLKILKLSQLDRDGSADEKHLECLSLMKTIADDLAANVPFYLRRFEVKTRESAELSSSSPLITLNMSDDIKPYVARLLIWPLSIASFVAEVDAEQALWFKSELARLGKILGYGIFQSLDTDQGLEL